MKINTDGVLLGALADAGQSEYILDIGTGTGVIALMLAQRFENARIDAVEIDQFAAEAANRNFSNSSFAPRLNLYPAGFEQFFESSPQKKYDLIISNPPFYINSLQSPVPGKRLAKHADKDFFQSLIKCAANQLNIGGLLGLILPIDTAELVSILAERANLHPQKSIFIYSFKHSAAHRLIIYFGLKPASNAANQFVIYQSEGNYSQQYVNLLKPFFTGF